MLKGGRKPPLPLTTPRNYETPQRQQVKIRPAISQQCRPNQGEKPRPKADQRRRPAMTAGVLIGLLIGYIGGMIHAAIITYKSRI